MNTSRRNHLNLWAIGLASLAILAGGCTPSSNGGSSNSGGSAAPGGTHATGGTTVAGGTTAKGGSVALGGTASAGGGTIAGGTTAKGGSSALGGTTSAGGSPAFGGTTAAGGSAIAGSAGASGGTTVGGSVASGGNTTLGGSTANGGTTAAGGTTASGGAGGSATGGKTSTGVSTGGTPGPVTCGSVTIPSSNDIIADFNNGTSLTTPVLSKRGGNTWDTWAPGDATNGDGTVTPGPSSPRAAGNTFAVDSTNSGPCNRGGSLHVKSPGNTDYGVGFGIDLQPFVDPVKKTKSTYDARADGYTGVGMWMKCSADVEYVLFKVVDANNDRDVATAPAGGACNYTSDTDPNRCNQYCLKNVAILKNQWQYIPLYFDEVLQDPAFTPRTAAFDPTKLTAVQVEVSTGYDRQGSNRIANPFECWVDDVYFLTTSPSPSHSANANPKTCTSSANGAAPGGYYTQGNKIMDCKTGNQKIFKGMARPSMEWDRAGWNINSNDLSRISSWKANVVRYSLNQSYWLDATKGAVYQAYVDRVVKWTLALGMDVILDLHWLSNGQANSPNADSSTFWQQVAAKYKNDGRVIFEIYNEPYGMDGTGWHNAMQPLVTAIRTTAGANNLILAGGLDWAYHLDQVLPTNALTGANIAYVTHPYDIKTNNAVDTAAWDAAFGNLAATYPIVATEFGQTDVSGGPATPTQKACNASFYTSMLNYFSGKSIGWTGWAWFVDHYGTTPPADMTCGFPQLITSYDGTTNSAGAVVKTEMGK